MIQQHFSLNSANIPLLRVAFITSMTWFFVKMRPSTPGHIQRSTPSKDAGETAISPSFAYLRFQWVWPVWQWTVGFPILVLASGRKQSFIGSKQLQTNPAPDPLH
jgi:hypothetical protein